MDDQFRREFQTRANNLADGLAKVVNDNLVEDPPATQDASLVPVSNFGKDHWSTFAYIETVMVDCGGFQVGFDPKMRQGRIHYRVMWQQCPKPKRPWGNSGAGVVMDSKYSTPLKDGTIYPDHDDWNCVLDLAAAGYFNLSWDAILPGMTLQLSSKGAEVIAKLRLHKSQGGSFGNFSL